MRSAIVFLLIVFASGEVFADAADGRFMGYQLGDSYPLGAQTRERSTASGNRAITAENPTKPANIGDVVLIVTPQSLTIGYISALTWFDSEAEAREFGRTYVKLLRAKYPTWSFGREVMDADMHVVEVNLDKAPHNLQMRLAKRYRDGESKWRLAITLRWLPDSIEGKAWLALSHAEQAAVEQKDRKRLLDQSDTRGL